MKKLNHIQITQLFRVLLVAAMLLSLFLVYEHFSTSTSEFCKIGANFDCGVVNKSPYANLDGLSYLMTIDFNWNIPLVDLSGSHWTLDLLTSNAFLGFLTLLFIFFLTFKMDSGWKFIKKEKVTTWMFGLLVFGIAYGVYLFFIQHYVIKSYCIFCIGLDVLLLSNLIISYKLKKVKK